MFKLVPPIPEVAGWTFKLVPPSPEVASLAFGIVFPRSDGRFRVFGGDARSLCPLFVKGRNGAGFAEAGAMMSRMPWVQPGCGVGIPGSEHGRRVVNAWDSQGAAARGAPVNRPSPAG